MGRHAPYCRCAGCGGVTKWAVYDGDKVFTVDNLSRVEIERRKQGKQLKDGRYWLKWDDVPVEAREAYLSVKRNALAAADPFDCPFCASIATLTCVPARAQLLHFVICANPDCGCSLKASYSPIEAVLKWNRRAIQLRMVVAKQQEAA